jgi:hypothetical protein
MSDFPTSSEPTEPIDAELLFLKLRRKQGNWVEWGQICQQLQKAGYKPQAIFEETGFEPIQQNQIIVAAQVYSGFSEENTTPEVLEHFGHRASDVLYEFRILTQAERAAAATFALQHQLDSDEAHEIAKALKDFSRMGKVPEAFSSHPGDAVACQAWTQARQKSDLQDRSRLIAKGLRYVHSDSARRELEKLLVTLVSQRFNLHLEFPSIDLNLRKIYPVFCLWWVSYPCRPRNLRQFQFSWKKVPFGM